MRRGAPPPEFRRGHLLLDPGDPSQEDPPKVFAVVEASADGKVVKVKSAGFGEAETRTLSGRLPHGWMFIHSELLARLLAEHVRNPSPDGRLEIDCDVCAVFGGPGAAEQLQKAGH